MGGMGRRRRRVASRSSGADGNPSTASHRPPPPSKPSPAGPTPTRPAPAAAAATTAAATTAPTTTTTPDLPAEPGPPGAPGQAAGEGQRRLHFRRRRTLPAPSSNNTTSSSRTALGSLAPPKRPRLRVASEPERVLEATPARAPAPRATWPRISPDRAPDQASPGHPLEEEEEEEEVVEVVLAPVRLLPDFPRPSTEEARTRPSGPNRLASRPRS